MRSRRPARQREAEELAVKLASSPERARFR
jgi:hypothetical protein